MLFLFFFSGICREGFCNNNGVDRPLSKALEAEAADETAGIQELDLQNSSLVPDVEAAGEERPSFSFQRADSKLPLSDNRHSAGSIRSMQDQGPDLDWERIYFGPLDDTIRFVQQVSDGGYIMVGETYSPSNGGSDIQLIKIDPRAACSGKTISVGQAMISVAASGRSPGVMFWLAPRKFPAPAVTTPA